MKDKAQNEDSSPKRDIVEGKDRRRFLKQMATCAIAVPVITVLPQMAVALTSGNGLITPTENLKTRRVM